ncbi:hypothetical protein EUGRSUZ_B01009 [Eucalyptus grandis]|uniref:Uncharacterized protein n=2 Tax=Eucalyptus grandis TaxID=71139 RepID=A0ACC3LQV6_EUCGR|nr:hypothetical protein EUGRSUZ_B01009 [Eucalyptus grandis]
MRWNTPTVQGMLRQVKRLVVIERGDVQSLQREGGKPPGFMLAIGHKPSACPRLQFLKANVVLLAQILI